MEEVTYYTIDDENNLPFGMLNNNFNFPFQINNQTWSNCSQYIYVNCLQYVLNYNTYFTHHKEKYIDQIMKTPTFKTYSEILQTISNSIRYNFYYKEILSKLLTEKNTDEIIIHTTWENHSIQDPILKDVLYALKNNLTIKQHYNYYPSYVVVKIISQFLTDELENFAKIQKYLQIIDSKKNVNIVHDIIKDYDFLNTRKLPLYDFEHEIEKNKELLKVLQLSHYYPNILFIYAFKYHLRAFKNRMDSKYRNKILELFLRYKNNYTESIKKEIYLVNTTKLKDFILEKVLAVDDKFNKYIEKDVSLREIINAQVSDEKIVEYETFNFYELASKDIHVSLSSSSGENEDDDDDEDGRRKKANMNQKTFMRFIQSLHDGYSSKSLPDNLERIKEVLATMAIYKKFNIPLPENLMNNYSTNLPEFFRSHAESINEDTKTTRGMTDMKFTLYMTRGVVLKYDTEDTTLAHFVGSLLSTLSKTVKQDSFATAYKDKDVKKLLSEDLFMEIWVKKQLQYISHLISNISLFLDSNGVSVTSDILTGALEHFTENKQFAKGKTTYDDLPASFCELMEYFFNLSEKDQQEEFNTQSFSITIWNFVTYNIQTILKTRDVFNTKSFLVKNILRLRQFHQCVENLDNNDIACYTFAVINVANKLDKLREKHKIDPKISTFAYVEAILLNEKMTDSDVSTNEASSSDITAIVHQIFTQNESVIKSTLDENDIVRLVDRIKDTDDKFKINIWVSLNF